MPIGFSDLLKTTAQLDNNLTKGIVSTDDTFGGIRSKIDDWTDLHTSTYNGGSGYTFQDDGTGAAPGHFKAYSTMFYVADGRALVETNTAEGAIRLDSNGEFVSNGGQLYTHGGGTAEPEYWVLSDPTQVGGTGSGTDKLPKFTITGTQGSGSTALPAGYQKLQVLTNAAPSTGAVSITTDLDNNLLSESSGQLGLDNQNANIVFAGPGSGSAAAPTFRALVTDDLADDMVTLAKLQDITDERLLGRVDNGDGTVAELTKSQVLTFLNVADGAQVNEATNLSQTTAAASLTVVSSTGNNVTLQNASASLAGVVTAQAQTFAGDKTFNNNLIVGGNLSVAGTVTQSNSQEVNFNDTRLRLNIPTGLLDGSIENTAAPSANTNVGLEIFNGAAGGAFSNGPLWVYNYNTDKWGASIQGSETTLDNVTAMKFDRTLTGLATDNSDIADLYGNSASAVSNDETARSLGGVSRCRITITTETTDGVNNFAPVTAAAVGYPIAHNLGTKAVFVVAIKDPDGTPIPVHCKYQPKTTNVCVVSVGITAEDEVYDIIVIG